jgi:hypothetical protein
VPINPPSHLFPRRGQRMQIVHHLPVKNRRPMIFLHAVSGPWTSFVAALDKGRFNIAVCGRYSSFEYSTKKNPPKNIIFCKQNNRNLTKTMKRFRTEWQTWWGTALIDWTTAAISPTAPCPSLNTGWTTNTPLCG